MATIIAFQPTGFQSTAFQEGVHLASLGTQSGISRRGRSYPDLYKYQGSIPTAPISFARINEMLGFVQKAMGKLETPAPSSDKPSPVAPDPAIAAAQAAKLAELQGMVAKLKEMAEQARLREEAITIAAIEAIELAQQDDDEAAILLLVA